MWNRPQLMEEVADLLFTAGVAALLMMAAIVAARLPLFRIREVVVVSELREVRRGEIERALAANLRGNFFSARLETFRKSLEQLPWVRRAEVRRRWPASIEVRIEEHQPVAFWGRPGGRLLNSHGEIFLAGISVPPPETLPVLAGPTGFAPEMLAYYRQAAELLKTIGRKPRALNVSPRLALQLKLDDGMIVELGRQQAKATIRERLERFTGFYPWMLTAAGQRPEVVDMRYPNGFALRTGAPPRDEGKGQP
ncbi:MAG: cell division protein FtsQ/DivIB [Candidatus Accumulibacter sp.]|jgi:cell division protein FtsQ|nr:cell division protein FtsQ/DivIB [Accumulibacter sp.]